MRYTARLEKEGKRTLAEFPDCPGCQTFAEPGEDVGALAREALEGWLELHLENGEAPPRPEAKPRRGAKDLLVRVDPSLSARLEIRWARQDLHLSQQELADRVGVSRQQISLFEGKGGNLTLQTLDRVAAALGRDIDIVFVRPDAA